MPSFHLIKDRRVIPRWRPVLRAVAASELDPLTSARQTEVQHNLPFDIAEQRQSFQVEPSLATAGDLLGAAFVINEWNDVHRAAQYILDKQRDSAPEALKRFATWSLGGPSAGLTVEGAAPDSLDDAAKRLAIRQLKEQLHLVPTDALGWVELSRQYTNLAQLQKAWQAMRTALFLARDNRFVVRSAVRLLVHRNKIEEAHWLVNRTPSLLADPWLLSTEIAVASIMGQVSPHMSKARRALNNGVWSAFHASELAAAMATTEFIYGSNKSGNRLIRQALMMPTENVLAQAAWLGREFSTSVNSFFEKQSSSDVSGEAQSIVSYYSEEWDQAVEGARTWQDDQPFSSRPATMGSYVAGTILDNHDIALQFTKTGLSANPNDFLILNNHTYSLVQLGRVKEAEQYFVRMHPSHAKPDELAVWNATRGLIQFRYGQVEFGRELYQKAFGHAQGKILALAAANWALEELRAGTESKKAAAGIALAKLDTEAFPDLKKIREKIERELSSSR